MIDREKFINIMNRLQAAWDIDQAVHDLGYKHIVNIDLDTSFLMSEVIDLLELVTGDSGGLIEWYIFQEDFGRSYKPDDLVNDVGAPIDISDFGKLYDYLLTLKD